MREILFRGKRLDNGEWVYGSYIQVDDSDNFCYIFERYNLASSLSPLQLVSLCAKKVDPETVGQFTGQYDKNGKRIFEGDILKAEIYRDVGCYPHTEIETILVETPSIYRKPIYRQDCEVIGNIHDNPELL